MIVLYCGNFQLIVSVFTINSIDSIDKSNECTAKNLTITIINFFNRNSIELTNVLQCKANTKSVLLHN